MGREARAGAAGPDGIGGGTWLGEADRGACRIHSSFLPTCSQADIPAVQ